MFGSRAKKYMILLFTRKDDLDGTDFCDYLKDSAKGTQELVDQFSNRYCVFNNKATGAELVAQREELLALVLRVVRENEGGYYSNQKFQKAEEEIQKQIQVRLEYYTQELEREKRQMIYEYQEEIKRLKDDLEREKIQAQMERALLEREKQHILRQQNVRDEVERQGGAIEFILTAMKIAYNLFTSLFDDD